MRKKKKEIQNNNLQNAINKIEKMYGKGIVMNVSEDALIKSVEVIPTGSLRLDLALGVKGIPRGRVIEIYGAESSGKTTLAYSIIKQGQKIGRCAFIDAEHSFDYDYAKKIGINLDDLLIVQPDFGEQALEILETLISSGELVLIVVDSVAALTPKAELEGEMEDATIGLQARLMSKALRKLTGIISKTKTSVIFINQTRMSIMQFGFGNPTTTSGGKALRFYASVRIELHRIKNITKGDNVLGTIIKAKIAKNKVAPPYRVAQFEIFFDEGLSESSDILQMALKYGILQKSGAWIAYKDSNIAQGDEQARQLLKSNNELKEELKNQILEVINKK
ncbi:recombinase RecA [Candidatus Pacearchaeota archaeon]|nr:MAG: recombinase RecA [Candidatus Pacearchaeota archaeon]